MNEYNKAKLQTKSAMNLWYVFVPIWFVTSIVAMNIGEALETSFPKLALFFGWLPLMFIPVWAFVVVKFGGFQGPRHLKCKKCGMAAYSRKMSIDWKFKGPTRDFKDICPNCGNDNRIDLHES